MQTQDFLAQHGIETHPFLAEDAKLDPIFDQLLDSAPQHPDYEKWRGDISTATTSILFGEKGAGKTALLRSYGHEISKLHANDSRQIMCVTVYNEHNAFLDNLSAAQKKKTSAEALANIRLADHQDAILSGFLSHIGDLLTQQQDTRAIAFKLPEHTGTALTRLSKHQRQQLMLLLTIYDKTNHTNLTDRWHMIRRKLRPGMSLSAGFLGMTALFIALLAGGIYGMQRWTELWPYWNWMAFAITGGLLGLSGCILFLTLRRIHIQWHLARRLAKSIPSLGLDKPYLRQCFAALSLKTLKTLPLPNVQAEIPEDARLDLFRTLRQIWSKAGGNGFVVIVDQVDEPTAISGNLQRMKQFVWPMLHAKFLLQENVGVKMLLPISLSHELKRENKVFFDAARLDKCNLIERFVWSGASLYDVCNARWKICATNAVETELCDIIEGADTQQSRRLLTDALASLKQPRDAMKFLHQLIAEHCKQMTNQPNNKRISQPVLEMVRQQQLERLENLERGLGAG